MEYDDRSTGYSTPSAPKHYGSKELMGVILRRRWIILGIALPIILLMGIGTIRSASSITASSQILVETRAPASPRFDNRFINDDVVMTTVAQIGKSIPVARKAAKALWDSLPVLVAENPGFRAPAGHDELTGLLLDGVECRQLGGSNVLKLSFTYSSPHFSLMAVEALTNGLIVYSVERMKNPQAVAYYTEQIEMVRSVVDSLVAARADVISEGGISAYSDNAYVSIMNIRSLEQEYYKIRSSRLGMEAELQSVLNTIEVNPDYVPISQALERLRSVLEKARTELNKLCVLYTDDSVYIKRQKEVARQSREDLYKERDNYLASLRVELERMQAMEKPLRDAVDIRRAELSSFPEIQRRLESIDLQIKSRRDLLENLHIKRGSVQMAAESDMRISNIIPLNEPTIDSVVGGSKKMLFLGLATIFAIVFGFLVAIFVDNQDHRIRDRHQAEHVLDVPVLGAITSEVRKDE